MKAGLREQGRRFRLAKEIEACKVNALAAAVVVDLFLQLDNRDILTLMVITAAATAFGWTMRRDIAANAVLACCIREKRGSRY